ncbi:MAG: dihydrofolate reductase family protein [Chloroflexi bacterium]|nr:dihydrofolate reductase family protein [Chloroflexota bacterium]MDA1003266.1 dihydrofolate reductase family protein [Chloroflexota bacterium]
MVSEDEPSPNAPAYHLIELPDPPPDRPYVFVNMVMSADGRVVIEGTERGLGSKTDQRLMRELRSLADVVLNGAGTLRASGSSSRLSDPALEARRAARGRPPVPTAAVVTNSADLPLERAFFTADDFPAIVYAGADAPQPRVDTILATGRPVVRLPSEGAIAFLLSHARHELGARALLVEGGPTLNGALFDGGYVDEFFLTLGPRVVGGHQAAAAVASARPPSLDAVTQLELLSAHPNPETSELYLRYRIRR